MKKLTLEALQNLFNFLEQQTDSVLWIRSKGYKRQLYLSPNFDKVFGYRADILYQEPGYFERMLLADDQKTSREMVQLDECGQAKTSYLYRIKLPHGETRYIKDWHYLLTDENDIILGIAGIAQVIPKEQWENEQQMQPQINNNHPQQVLQNYILGILKNELHIHTENISKNSPKLPGPEILNKNGQPIELTTRENECLYYLLAGKSAKQTAAILNISQRTVEFHLDNIKMKAGCRSKLELLGKVKSPQL